MSDPRRRRRKRILVAVAIGAGGLGLVAAAAIATAIFLRPYPADDLRAGAGTGLVITDRAGVTLRVLSSAGSRNGRWVALDQIAPEVLLATVAGEDQRFFAHAGVDARALLRAAGQALRRGRVVSGASTITMQLARTLRPHGNNSPRARTLLGKLREMIDAARIERTLGKSAVLEHYLNRIYYGNGATGIEAAARMFFAKSAATLSPAQATLLAVLPRAPSAYNPRRHLATALARRAEVLTLMERNGVLTASDRRRLEAEPLALASPHNHESSDRMSSGEAPHFVDWVAGQLSPDEWRRGGVLRTTLDLNLQRRLETAVRLRGAARPGQQAGVVVLDPTSGAVRAMVGSADHAAADGGQVNITTAARHPGSTLKPFIYALALEQGATAASIAHDTLGGSPGYRPGRRVRERGPARFREALAGSFNLAAVDVLGDVGVATLLERLRNAGVGPLPGTASGYGLDLALGSGRVRLLDLAAAYSAFLTGGLVPSVRLRAGEPGQTTRLFSAATSWLVMDMLADPNARRAAFGEALPFDLPFPVAAKTGTSSGFADTLAIGATREAVVAAWTGAFDGSGTRGTLAMWSAAPLARAALRAVADLNGAPLSLPPAPPEIVARDVCRVTGLRPGADCPSKRERFARDHVPAQTCAGHPLAAVLAP